MNSTNATENALHVEKTADMILNFVRFGHNQSVLELKDSPAKKPAQEFVQELLVRGPAKKNQLQAMVVFANNLKVAQNEADPSTTAYESIKDMFRAQDMNDVFSRASSLASLHANYTASLTQS